jgi:acetylornithine deacetylase
MPSYLHEVARRLIAFDTVSAKSNAAAAAYLADELARHGFRVACREYEDDGVTKVNVVATAGPPVAGGLVVSGHIDVVPFADQAGWTRDPLTLAIDDARLHGRGTSDMKGFLAQCVAAAATVERAGLRRPLVFVFTADEEIGCRGARRLVPELPMVLGDVPPPALAWIGEPTGWRVHHAHKGIVVFTVTAHGVAGHSSLPERGQNAIAVMAKAIAVIGALQAELRASPRSASAADFPDCPYTPLNLGAVRGGSADNMIADRCTLSVSYRPLPDDDPSAVHRELARRIAAADLRDPGAPDASAQVDVGPPSVVAGMRSPRGTTLEATLRAVLGADVPHGAGGAPFATDGGELERGGIASVVCGPGELEQAHQPNESMPRAAFERGVDVIRAVVERLCMT